MLCESTTGTCTSYYEYQNLLLDIRYYGEYLREKLSQSLSSNLGGSNPPTPRLVVAESDVDVVIRVDGEVGEVGKVNRFLFDWAERGSVGSGGESRDRNSFA
eukprot:SAG11_NODE_2916_length_2840_cov_13.306457_3_plen_102_part_00